jgi:CRP-like cAMP-binding protein/Fe-S-cluster-containing hydrogenase component 2
MAKELITAHLGGQELSPEELAAIPDFASIRKELWAKFPGAIARKIYEPGDILVTEGDFGTTAFYILSGEVDVYLHNGMASVQARRKQKRRWYQGLTKITSLVRGVEERQPNRSARTHIPIDGSVDLPIDRPVAVLGPGELFGELCALAAFKQEKLKRPKFYPRSATVRAKTRVEALEMLPHILNNVFYNSPQFREKLNDNYRKRALDNHLRSVPVFQNLSAEFLDYLRQRVELVHYSPGQVICRQGEVADAFYLIRLGFVKISQEFPGGEMVLTYLSRGSYFGEMGLLPPLFRVLARGRHNEQVNAMLSRTPLTVGSTPRTIPQLPLPWDSNLAAQHFQMVLEGQRVRVNLLPGAKSPILYRMQQFDTVLVQPGETFVVGDTNFEVQADYMGAGRRVATCTAIDFVQMVRISAEDFTRMLDENPTVQYAVGEVAHARWEMDRKILNRVHKVSLNDFLGQELMQAQNLLLIDLDKCTRCDECVKACAATHEDGVTRLIRDGLRFDNYLVPTTCRACMDPLCMTRCPVGSIRRKDTLDIVIEDWCIGCGNCAIDCPYGNINVVGLPENQEGQPRQKASVKGEAIRPKATVCDLCVEFPEPNCVRACPHDAAIRVDPKVFFARELAGVQLSASTLNALSEGSSISSLSSTFSMVPTAAPAPPPPEADRTERLINQSLKVINGDKAGTVLLLRYPSTTFGRGADVDHSFPEIADISRLHCRIALQRSGKLVVTDNQSRNGTFVNGNLIDQLELQNGDMIEIGGLQLQLMNLAEI